MAGHRPEIVTGEGLGSGGGLEAFGLKIGADDRIALAVIARITNGEAEIALFILVNEERPNGSI